MTNMISGILVFVVIVVCSIGVIGLSQSLNDSHSEAMNDPVNNSGIQSGENVKIIDAAITDNLPTAILIGLFIAALIFI
ncbi:MAG: hypothetical protein Q8T08_06925, partial [Ignavibacteria bacterium]|nr:hypothetical protein [Ignavibacteria bacterium]